MENDEKEKTEYDNGKNDESDSNHLCGGHCICGNILQDNFIWHIFDIGDYIWHSDLSFCDAFACWSYF